MVNALKIAVIYSLGIVALLPMHNTSYAQDERIQIDLNLPEPPQDTQALVEGELQQNNDVFFDAQPNKNEQSSTTIAPTPPTPADTISETPQPDVQEAPTTLSSMFFTRWERAAIADALSLRGVVRPVAEGELLPNNILTDPRPKPPPEERNIVLSGIVFNGLNDWVIWLNGQRVTPEALPTQILDLKVHKEFIEMKWYDDYTQKILPIRLRPNQRFNVDTRIFLPG